MAGHAWLEQHRDAINALNVFPVPDGDTGTNMSLTMRAATKEIADASETSACVIAERLARGALMGARGNSGVILSQILRGLSQGLDQKTTFAATDFAAALQDAAKLAYRAVIKPVEGTILTVIRESAEAAQQSAGNGSDMAGLLGDVVTAARAAVAKTPDLLPTLKQAGVVDAGGQGVTTIFEGMWRHTRGESVQPSHSEQAAGHSQTDRGKRAIGREVGDRGVLLPPRRTASGRHGDARARDARDRHGGSGGRRWVGEGFREPGGGGDCARRPDDESQHPGSAARRRGLPFPQGDSAAQ